MIIFLNNFFKFGFISALGLMIDCSIFYFLLKIDDNIFFQNYISSLTAIIFVYLLSNKYLSKEAKITSNSFKLIVWVIYQIVNITFFSWLIAMVYNFGINPLISKVIVIFLSFTANYFMMTRIILNKKFF